MLNADFIFFMMITAKLSAGCWFPSRSPCSWGMFWVCCIGRLCMGLDFSNVCAVVSVPRHGSAQGFPMRAAGLCCWNMARAWTSACDLPGQATPAMSCFCFPHPQPSLHHPRAQHLCSWLARTHSPSSGGLINLKLAIPC